MRFPTLVFDIETLTDLKAGAHLYHLDLPEADVEQALTKNPPPRIRYGFSAFTIA